MAAHAWWRVRVDGCPSVVGARDIEMRTVPGGANVATGGTVSAFAEYGAPYLSSNAFDGDAGTAWYSGSGPLGWIQYHFAAAVAIEEIAWTVRADFGGSDPTGLTIQSSDDGATWTDEWFYGNLTWTPGLTRLLPRPVEDMTVAGPHRAWWRIAVPTVGSGGAVNGADIEFRKTAGGAQAAVFGIVIAFSEYGPPYQSSNLFDNNVSTSWYSNGAAPGWVGYHFNVPTGINEIQWRVRNDFSAGDPTELRVQSSPDGVTWTDEWAALAIPAWAPGEARVYTRPVTARSLSATLPVPLGMTLTLVGDTTRHLTATLPVPLRATATLRATLAMHAVMRVPLGLNSDIDNPEQASAIMRVPLGLTATMRVATIMSATMRVPLGCSITFGLTGPTNAATRTDRHFGARTGRTVLVRHGVAATTRGGRGFGVPTLPE